MSSPCDPEYAPVGDVGAALMMIDSRLREIHAGRTEVDPEHQQLIDQFTASLGPEGANDVVDGACTLIFMYLKWLREAHEAQGEDVIECVVPNLVATMQMMPRSVGPEAIPTMIGLVIAAATGVSPTLWRKQYGNWTEQEMTPLEVTTFLLAEYINRMTDDPDFATRIITEALTNVEGN